MTQNAREQILALEARVQAAVVGQEEVIRGMMLALLADGHCLLEGLPGLAKTRSVKHMAAALAAKMSRIQFTPDLLPADVTGSEIYEEKTATFRFDEGPIFANLVLADEINRAPAKVQSALLEAMEERQVTVAGTTHPLEKLFLVFATQNPVEQEGTYALPEAQLDRFLLHLQVNYPTPEQELQVLRLVRSEERGTKDEAAPIPQSAVFAAREGVSGVTCPELVERYIVDLVVASRSRPELIELGASPRATIALDRASRALAWLEDKDHSTPDHVRAVAPSVLRHRIRPSYEASGRGLSSQDVVEELLQSVAVG